MSASSFQKSLDKYRSDSFSERDKGDRFERLMQAYLQTDPTYTNQLKAVWLWNEFPAKNDFGGKDIGIDIVAQTFEGDYWAIQCKCYAEDALMDKKSVDSFLATSSKQFHNDQKVMVGFTHRLWMSTTNNWGSNAEEAIRNQNPPVSRLNLFDLQEAPVDWELLEKGITGSLARKEKKTPFEHQEKAIADTHEHFKNSDRGKLIMACGTGKTFTSLRIAEKETDSKGLILFLVPSIALLGQTLREWSGDATEDIHPICICSDSRITKTEGKNSDDSLNSVVDLAMPASTNVENIVKQFQNIKEKKKKGMTVVFSTYQSIEVIAQAQGLLMDQEDGYGVFDLIICDEAHRTTGVTLKENDDSAFVRVHDNEFIEATKRLYMTATPRLYSDDSKSKAAEKEAFLWSMDNETLYGEEIYRIGFGEAVELNLLSDYKVLILTLSEDDMTPVVQNIIAAEDGEISTDDASKLIGCINAMSKQVKGDEGLIKNSDPEPMRRAVAFCSNIKVSKQITSALNTTSDVYVPEQRGYLNNQLQSVGSKHIDGSMSAPQRDQLMGWLKDTSADTGECRVLTNVRCLSEGVDVPSLDAVLFLSPRNSQVDVVQSVGRVMRKAPGKKYGYIIIPIVIPTDVEPSKALDDNKRYKVVWSVLNALRAHDDRFNSTINKIDLNKKKPNNISVVTLGDFDGDWSDGDERGEYGKLNRQMAMQFEELQAMVYAKMVVKVGDKVYWEKWAKDVAVIAERQIERIHRLIKEDAAHRKAFAKFLEGLQKNINNSITEQEAVEMLSQHVITKPVFEALFDGYSFVENNPISQSMQGVLDLLEAGSVEQDTEVLHKFYESVKQRAAGIDNSEGKQRIIVELYDKFFKTAFPKLVEKLGIVYTPVEVVDFIIHSVNDVLKKEFRRSVSDEDVHILDPFTGTGTFMTRLLQSGLIKPEDLERKFKKELHANELVLLAYYIAAVNIENAYHDLKGEETDYESFEGICLTDTFQLGETEDSVLFSEMFPKNSERLEAQRKGPIRVIMGNPPYSVGQKSANDNAANQKYKKLDKRIEETYAKGSSATSVKALYDAYIKAFRWSTDRLDSENGGVLAFVSNGAWLDANGMDGFRKSIEEEFDAIYVFNLRGNQRTSGELSRKEGGKIFGSGSRTPISITLLIRNPEIKTKRAKIYYNDIGDYHTREEKLTIVKGYSSFGNSKLKWTKLEPNEHGDWINKRSDSFKGFIPMDPNKKMDTLSESFFLTYSLGLATGRDAWVINANKKVLQRNVQNSINFYNSQVEDYKGLHTKPEIDDFIDTNPLKNSWNRNMKQDLVKGIKYDYSEKDILTSPYRPFFKMNVYFNKEMNAMLYQNKKLFPDKGYSNWVICVTGKSASRDFSAYMTSDIPNLDTLEKAQCFPLYYYEKREQTQSSLFEESSGDSEYIRRDGVSDFILTKAKKQYGKNVKKEDIFYYVYGILHNEQYRTTFANDLKKMLPRLPLVDDVKDFWRFSQSGRLLADLHLNYEAVVPHPDVEVVGDDSKFFEVSKMRFPKKDQKDTILFNSKITISNIPEEAYEYMVNGKSAIEWIMERYQVKTEPKSGIKNDPNDWADEVGNPRYILDLLLSIINVSTQTVEIVKGLPEMKFD